MRRTADGSTVTPARFDLEPLGVTLGAEVSGLDLRLPLDDATFDELERCWLEWKVLVFREQHLTVLAQAGQGRAWPWLRS